MNKTNVIIIGEQQKVTQKAGVCGSAFGCQMWVRRKRRDMEYEVEGAWPRGRPKKT